MLKSIAEIFNSLRVAKRFFIVCAIILLCISLSLAYWILFPIALSFIVILLALVIVDYYMLFSLKSGIESRRELPSILGLGDDFNVIIHLKNNNSFSLYADVYDELPTIFQERDFKMSLELLKFESRSLNYSVRPTKRGNYQWGNTNCICRTKIGFLERHYRLNEIADIPCFPSILQMKNFELKAFAKIANFEGIKKVRRLGHSYEFEQIKQYIQGDDLRSVNWKATSRRNSLMVNQYEDERSQQVYCILDKSRSMHMPFKGLSLLDYSINTSLIISNIVLKKHDKSGLISFSDKLGTVIKAEKSRLQLKKILYALYKETHRENEVNFDLLYHSIKKMIRVRSLIFLFSNFESRYALERALPLLRKINNLHLLVVIIFKNTELEEYAHKKAETIRDVYAQTIANKLSIEKRNMSAILQKYGIQTILTEPEELSLHSVNKYLELKAKGLI